MDSSPKVKFPAWHIVEEKIKKEIDWLYGTIETFSKKEPYEPVACQRCIIRNIAILIVTGQIKATQINRKSPLESFWINDPKIKRKQKKIHHGQDWHRETMEKIENHFFSKNYEVIREPTMFWGRADLGVYKKGKPNLSIEVGTTSFFKLLANLKQPGNYTYLIVPSDDKLIEFTRKK